MLGADMFELQLLLLVQKKLGEDFALYLELLS